MTKSTITRDKLRALAVKKVESLKFAITQSAFTNIRRGLEEELQLAEFALAAMDSEPVAWTDEQELRDVDRGGCGYLFTVNPVTPHADERRIILLYRHAQPAPASPVCTCPSGDGSLRWPCPVHPGNSPAQSDCCPAQNSVNPAQGGNYLVIPDEMTSEQAYEIGYYYGDPVDVFARGANWMRQHIIDSTLAAAPQSPGSEPATVPGKWIPVSEQKPDCWCLTCRPVTLNDMRFVVCPDCGNKRCPRANDHRNACTGSNEPGQEGSAYPDTTQEPKP